MKIIKQIGFALIVALLAASVLFVEQIPLPMPVIAILRLGLFLALVFIYTKDIFLPNRFFILMGGIGGLFVASFFVPILYLVAQASLLFLGVLVILDALLLFRLAGNLEAKRSLPKLLSLGDDNNIKIEVMNPSGLNLSARMIDELPIQFQKRDFELETNLSPNKSTHLSYQLRPTQRGEYVFRDMHFFIQSFLGILERRVTFAREEQRVPVYPSVIQMKKYELMTVSQIAFQQGVKKVRRLGHSYEFEQVRNYVKGDDYRSINWKATSRRNVLMVNQYEDERSQQIFCVIDKGRSMEMPFGGMSLMDYAINTALVITNIALQKHDRAGLLTFSDKIGATVKAESGAGQLKLILEALYKEEARIYEANYELFYTATKQFIRRRSLVFLYTNFESFSAMARVLPILRKIAKMHLLVVVFFENTQILDFAQKPALTTEDIYYKTIAQRFADEKHRMVQELTQYGIQSLLTRPEALSVDSLNKYLELKARNMI